MGVLVVGAGGGSRSGGQSAVGSSEDAADEATWARLGLAPLMATLLLPIIIGVIVLIKCVFNSCCARRTTTKEEMYGVEGRMTMLPNNDIDPSTHHERSSSPSLLTPSASLLGNYSTSTHATTSKDSNAAFDKIKATKVLMNNNNPVVSVTSDIVSSSSILDATLPHNVFSGISIPNAESDHADTLKRATGKRQLPDLPQIPQSLHPPRRSSSVLSHDTTSELYATVGEVPNSTSKSGTINPYAHLTRRQCSAEDSLHSNNPSTSRGVIKVGDGSSGKKNKGSIEMAPSSDSETYATTSNHPYAKLKRNPNEHPYARVRNSSLGNDEETDTDNYDIPQPYAQTRGRPVAGASTGTNNQSISNDPSTSSSGSTSATAVADGPVPPRRIGRQWRRGSHPQGQNVDTSSHFSGDSQDSRGYTSISVREPLSNIRSQTAATRHDSHYATVSDDSEEMYAAIEDTSEGNYMQISEGDRPTRPSWLEHREANSPLPPVPAVPPPETPGESGTPTLAGPAPLSPSLAMQPGTHVPPVYAQVTKKPKKGKAPVTPTASNASSSSQIHSGRETNEIPSILEQLIPSGGANSCVTNTQSSGNAIHHSSSHTHHHHHRSKSRTLMDNSNLLEAGLSDNRRWSKADISYSEFEVVREGFPPLESKKSPIMPMSMDRTPVSPRNSLTASMTEELVDEDNYNVIADKREDERISRSSKRSSGGRSKKATHNEVVDSDNYQEIDHISNNTYQEIGGGKEPSDHYQEIGAGSSFIVTTNGDLDDDDEGPNPLYQVIRKKEEDYEDEEEDEFYEKVKPASSSKSTLSVSTTGYTKDRKHGYEKLKRKGKSPSPKGKSGSEDDDEEDEEVKEDDMYERVKYPPYERLKESRSDLAVDKAVEDDDDDDEGSNLYEHIGYSRVKPKRQREQDKKKMTNEAEEKQEEGCAVDSSEVDVNQLYAVVDKSKKKNKNTCVSASKENNSNNNNVIVNSNVAESSNLRSLTPTMRTTPTPTKRESVPKSKPNLSALSAGVDLEFIDDSVDIEYI